MNTVEIEGLEVEIKMILQIYAIRWKINIRAVGVPDDVDSIPNLTPPNMRKNRLDIYFRSSASVGPFSDAAENSIAEVFGEELLYTQRDGVKTSLIGYPITDSDGNVAAEVVGNTIYIPFDLASYEDWEKDKALVVLKRILDAYEKIPGFDDRLKIEGEKRKALRSASFQNFQNFFRRSNFTSSQIKKQYDYIYKISKGDLVVTEEEIRFNLGKTQYRQSGGSGNKINIGEILVVMRPNDWNDSDFVQVFYLDPRYHGKHDHVYSYGGLCLGNIYTGVEQFLKKRELALAAEAMMIFARES